MAKLAKQSEVFEQILLSHAEMCYSVALALTRDPDRAQELARHVLTDAWHLRESAEGRAHIKKKLLTGLRQRFLLDRCKPFAIMKEASFAGRA